MSRRIISSKTYKSSISAPIVKIAIAAVVLSIVMILISIATGIGLKKEIRNKISTFSGDIFVSNYDNNHSEVTLTPITISDEIKNKINNTSGVLSSGAVATKAGVIRRPNTFEGIIYKGLSKEFPVVKFENYLTKGRLPNLNDEKISNEIIVSEYLARRLNIDIDSIAQTYFLRTEENKRPWIRGFKVVGIFNSGMEQFDNNYIYGDLKHIQKMNKWEKNQIGSLDIYIDDFSNIDKITQSVYENTPATLNASSITDKYYNIFEWIKLFDTNILIILSLMILVAAINMIVALLVLILERSQMIGILKTLGASSRTIQRVFLFQASYILLYGLTIGNTIALLLLWLQKHYKIVTLDPSQYYVSAVPVDINWLYILLVNILFIVICYFIMLLPSFIIVKMNPITSIKKD